MASIIIPASKSLTVTNKLPDQSSDSSKIKVGCKQNFCFISYLYFDISSIPANAKISNAELVLFKENNFYEDNRKKLVIFQLEDYFSDYTTYNNRPEINKHIKVAFYPFTSKVSVTIDITKFVLLWLGSEHICTGIMVVSEPNCGLSEFGSAKHKDSYMIPFVKVYYEGCCKYCCHGKPTVREVNVTGTVAPESKYEAIVDLEVTRQVSGNKDNYYVTDEYDNTLSSEPLQIDKTYKIAVIPKERPGDSEKIELIGSYKEE